MLAPLIYLSVLIPASQVAWAESVELRPPDGWENEVVSGVAPSVESTLVNNSAYCNEEVEAYWDRWDTKALDAVIRLYEDERWDDYNDVLLKLLFLCPLEEAEVYIKDSISELACTAGANHNDEWRLYDFCRRLTWHKPALAETVLQSLLDVDSNAVRQVVVKTYANTESAEALDTARALLELLPDKMQDPLLMQIAGTAGRMRAKEPMTTAQAHDVTRRAQDHLEQQQLGNLDLRLTTGTDDELLERWVQRLTDSPNAKNDLQRLDRTTAGRLWHAAKARIGQPSKKYSLSHDKDWLVRLVSYLREPDSISFLQQLLSQAGPDDQLEYYRSWQLECVIALADMMGDDAVPFLEALIARPGTPPRVKTCSIIGLGRIGSQKSVAAYVRLRDQAFEKTGVPERKTEYTHAEKIAEAYYMTIYIISDRCTWCTGSVPGSIVVSEEYLEGELTTFDGCTFSIWRLRRFGSEWLVTGLPEPGKRMYQ